MRNFLFQIIASILPTGSRAEKAELPLQVEKASPTII
jgi:hypothetical protein